MRNEPRQVRGSVGTGWSGAKILRLGENPSFHLQVLYQFPSTRNGLRSISVPGIHCVCCFDVKQGDNKRANYLTQSVHQSVDGHRLFGLVVKAFASRAEGQGFESRLRRDFFPGRIILVTSKLALQWLPCQAPGVVGSALGLGEVESLICSFYLSVAARGKLSEQIRP